eukprot:TRINITY_DN24778_c0_g1_i2.p1 TRINITY_DN24778_c0_g1~~TRINITY_DN24778_c0_g1_i2.p1  ORF type:complete len:527 (-),score=100.46 TRINITY_DN24778_c0_g1_i2:34-1614(-)
MVTGGAPPAFWGRAACFGGGRSFESCCVALDAGAVRLHADIGDNGTARCWPHRQPADADACCGGQVDPPRLRGNYGLKWARQNPWLQGCASLHWDQVLLAVMLGHDFLRHAWSNAYSRDAPTQFLADRMFFWMTSEPSACELGRFFAKMAFLFNLVDGTAMHAATAPALHQSLLLDLPRLEAAFPRSGELFAITGTTSQQIRYVLFGAPTLMPLPTKPFLPPAAFPAQLRRKSSGGDRRGSWSGNRSRRGRILDIGLGGGLNTLVWLLHGFDVVGVEASQALLEHSVRPLLRSYEAVGRLALLHAAVVPATHGEKSVKFVADTQQPEESHVEFQPSSSAGDVAATTCGALLRQFAGDIVYLKCDAQFMDLHCARDIDSADDAPPFASFELPTPLTAAERLQEAQELILHLKSVGYAGFKLCRQGPYHATCHLGARCHGLALNAGYPLIDAWRCWQPEGEHRRCEGQPWTLGLSGLFGDSAVDWLRGEEWASAAEVLSDLIVLRAMQRRFRTKEHFDLHVRHASHRS